MNSGSKRVVKICITGGPCSGRTTAVSKLKEAFSGNFTVYTLPEVSALISVNNNVVLSASEGSHKVSAAVKRIRLQNDVENFFDEIALNGSNGDIFKVVSGGALDHLVGLSEKEVSTLIEENGFNLNFLCRERYDLVVHLVTAAAGAEDHFITKEGAPRSQTLEEAREADLKILAQWKAHPNLIVIDNSVGSFNQKMEKMVSKVAQFFGIEHGPQRNKFLLEGLELPTAAEAHKTWTVKETLDYLETEKPSTVTWVACQLNNKDNFPVYSLVTREITEDTSKQIERRSIISERNYKTLLNAKSKKFARVENEMTNFMIFDGQHSVHQMSVNQLRIGEKNYSWLRTDSALETVPEPLKKAVVKDISNVPDFYTFKLAMI